MIGPAATAVALVMCLPLLLLGAGAHGTSVGSRFAGRVPTAYDGGSDESKGAELPPAQRAAVLAAARRYALPPALLAAVEPTDPMAAARRLLDAGALPGGGWDAALALSAERSPNEVDAVLRLAADRGYHYDPNLPPLDPTRYVFPLRGTVSYGPYHHDYPATDIFAAIGTPVLACVRAEVLRLSRTDIGRGGLSITLRGEDGWRYYYAHLSAVAADLTPGAVVEPGQMLGQSGDTGDAHGTVPRLHLGISQTGNAQGQVSPYPYLQSWPRT